jgi:hypothetical protein
MSDLAPLSLAAIILFLAPCTSQSTSGAPWCRKLLAVWSVARRPLPALRFDVTNRGGSSA